jgi:hypothetical protein
MDKALFRKAHDYHFHLTSFRTTIPFSVLGFDDVAVALEGPWPLALGLGSVAVYALFYFVLWPLRYRGVQRAAKASAAAPPPPHTLAAFAHFAALAVYSAGCCGAVVAYLIASGEAASPTQLLCAPVPRWVRLLSLSFTASKVWEWADTGIHFSRGEPTGFLHSFHHATTFLLFLLVSNFPSAEKLGMVLNGAVHTLMYTHYAFRLPRWARPLITATQIVQLITTIWVWIITPGECPALADFPRDHQLMFLLPFGLVPVYLIFFIIFFARNYIFVQRTVKAKGGE